MSQVRAAFDGESFHCTASAAVALSTRFNADFHMTHREERTLAILVKKWQGGATLLVTPQELDLFAMWIQQTRPQGDLLHLFARWIDSPHRFRLELPPAWVRPGVLHWQRLVERWRKY